MPDRGALVLVVEDELAQRELLAFNLRKVGYDVRTARDGDEAEQELADQVPDLVLLDWMLPGVSGLELGRRIRRAPATRDVPIIMLTARAEEEDIIRGLDSGADDYITKPYSVSELLARVRSTIRRNKRGGSDTLQVDEIEMNVETYRVTAAGQEVRLGPLEFKLLRTLMERPGRAFEREQLLDLVWGQDIFVGGRTVDVHVARLRKALGPAHGSKIRTIRGKGYALG